MSDDDWEDELDYFFTPMKHSETSYLWILAVIIGIIWTIIIWS